MGKIPGLQHPSIIQRRSFELWQVYGLNTVTVHKQPTQLENDERFVVEDAAQNLEQRQTVISRCLALEVFDVKLNNDGV